MNISFQKKQGEPSLGILFFWKMTVEAKFPLVLTDHFIPELFFDYFFIKRGTVECIDLTLGRQFKLLPQTLKTIHTHPLILLLYTPLVVYGARFSLKFAESFWDGRLPANSFLAQSWVSQATNTLKSFASRVLSYVQEHHASGNPHPMLSHGLEESDWLVQFSPRHKRRLYTSTFGLSRKELQGIHNIHSFLEQTCDFATQNPRIIQHINPDVFYDQPHLNHTFKKMTGFSPVEFFQASSILQDNLMSASYNENPMG